MAANPDRGAIRHIGLLGPTASGKSAVAIEVAKECGSVHVFSLDAFQVYRSMDIGTGKVLPEEREGVPHHLMDLVDPVASFSVADYCRAARQALAGLRPGATVLWVGGAGLYWRAIREGLADIPPTDPKVEAELSGWSREDQVEELRRGDPEWSRTADLQNPRRVMRALAVLRQTGLPLSEWQKQESVPVVPLERVFYLAWPDPDLRERMGLRIRRMWERGWPAEVNDLQQRPGWRDSQSARAIGYGDVIDFLEGRVDEEGCRRMIESRTWQYARRQKTWFRKEPGQVHLDGTRPGEAVKTLVRFLQENQAVST